MNNINLTSEQEKQVCNFIEEKLQDMSYQDLLEITKEKLTDFYFDWTKEELIECNIIKEENND